MARRLAAAGYQLVLADIQEDRVAAGAAEIGATSTPVDISDPDSCQAMVATAVDRLGGLDGLVQVAGLDAPPGTALTTHRELWRRVIDIVESVVLWYDHASRDDGDQVAVTICDAVLRMCLADRRQVESVLRRSRDVLEDSQLVDS